MSKKPAFVVRAVRTKQADYDVFAFFSPGARLLEIADVPTFQPTENGSLAGFQRSKIIQQVKAIAEYIKSGPVLFPNAIILAISSDARFVAARGSKPTDVESTSEAGTLTIPVRNGRRSAWIVDGQQRALALSEVGATSLQVPVVAFVSDNISTQRAQFILVNKAKPLPARLIDELLPEVAAQLPRDLSPRKLPSALCTTLNESRESPFFGIIKRPSTGANGIITDSALTRVMRRSIADPRGCLAAFVSPDGVADIDEMFRAMVAYWSAVRDVFPSAWGLPPDRSRLMHSAGIEAMGILMDQIMTQAVKGDAAIYARQVLTAMAPRCCWTGGTWEGLNRRWNEIQNTPRDVKALSALLISFEREAAHQ